MLDDNEKMIKRVPFFSRYVIKENDERIHYNNFFKLQEWWYFNTYFNHPYSDLKNWSMTLSLCTFPHTDSIKFVLHDDKKNSHGKIYIKPIKSLKVEDKNVDIKLGNFEIKGKYPRWIIKADNKDLDEKNISADLKFEAKTMPIWIIKNTGLNQRKSPFGYYCIMRCEVRGTVTIDKKTHKVQGIGYHDHTWMPLLSETSKEREDKLVDFNVWDWLLIHFENDWDLFIGKINASKRSAISQVFPGSFALARNNKLSECIFFTLKYIQVQNSCFESVKIPKKIHIKTLKINPISRPFSMDVFFESENITELISRDPPTWGQWEITGKAYAEYRSLCKKTKLKGWGILETTHHI